MGMDALAYLWYGTKPQAHFESYETLGYSERQAFEASMVRRGVKFVHIHSDDFRQFALATLASYHSHDWALEAKRIDALPNPSAAELAALRTVASELPWPFDETALGWYMGSTIWV